MSHLHIDPFAGISGDMFLGACLDLGADLDRIEKALRALPTERSFSLEATDVLRHAIRAVDFKVHLGSVDRRAASGGPTHTHDHDCAHDHDHGHGHSHGHDHSHDHDHSHSHSHSHDAQGASCPGAGPTTGYGEILEMIQILKAPARVKARAKAVLDTLGYAEAHVHGLALQQVHFHEVGAVDSIVDMLGAALALEQLEVETISCGPLPVGRGFVKCDHGTMPLPAPATAQILLGVPHHGVDREFETVTPTGAAIAAALSQSFGPMPLMKVQRIGYGAGDRDPEDVPNVLRLFLGQRLEA